MSHIKNIFALAAVIFTWMSLAAPEENLQPQEVIIRIRPAQLKALDGNNKAASAVVEQIAHYGGFQSVRPFGSKSNTSDKALSQRHFINTYVVTVSDVSLDLTLDRLRALTWIEMAQPNFKYQPDDLPNDPRVGEQWALEATGMAEAWRLTRGSPNVTIAIIGGGVDTDHEDLNANIWENMDEIAGNGVDDDANGFVDDTRGWNFEHNNNAPVDRNGHETAVAGVAAAVGDNGIGITGVCQECKIMPLRVGYNSEDVAEAIIYAMENGAKVVNMSFGNYEGRYGQDTVVKEAADQARQNGVFLVATAGNETINRLRYPAALDSVLAVASTDQTGRSGFSNWGSWVDMSAPGSLILSTQNGGGYELNFGTSFSAPFISGVAALILSRFPEISMDRLRERLMYTATRPETNYDKPIGTGQVNPSAALAGSGRPELFAYINSPYDLEVIATDTTIRIEGTALGESYVLDYRLEGDQAWTVLVEGVDAVETEFAQLDAANLTVNNYYILRLSATRGDQTTIHQIRIALADETIYQSHVADSNLLCPPKLADINGDGEKEVIFGANNGQVHALNADLTPLPGWPKTIPSNYLFGSPGIGDIDGDGVNDVVVTSYGFGGEAHLVGMTGTGRFLFTRKLSHMRGAPVLVNLDDDPALEIVVNSREQPTRKVYVMNGAGLDLPGWPVELPEMRDTDNAPAVGDLNGDGQLEIVVSTAARTYVFDAQGRQLPFIPRGRGGVSPLLVDLEGDGTLEIILLDFRKITAFNHRGEPIWTRPIPYIPYVAHVSAGSLTPDEPPAIFFAAPESVQATTSIVFAWRADGGSVPGWPKRIVGSSNAEVLLTDLDSDGRAEVVTGTEAGNIYAWHADGSDVNGFPKVVGEPLATSPAVGDLDGDGNTDLLFAGFDGTFFQVSLATPFSGGFQPWPNSRGDATNSGAYAFTSDEGTAIPFKTYRWAPHITSDSANFKTEIEFSNPKTETIQLELTPYTRDGMTGPPFLLSIDPQQKILTTAEELFGNQSVSHFSISGPFDAPVRLFYSRNDNGLRLPVDVPGLQNVSFRHFRSTRFHSVDYFACALVNIGSEPATIVLEEVHPSSNDVVAATVLVENLAPGAKHLVILNDYLDEGSAENDLVIRSNSALSSLFLDIGKAPNSDLSLGGSSY